MSARPPESSSDRRARARALAKFFAAGALLSTAVVLLPGWDGMHVGGIAVTIVAAGSGAATLHVLGDRFGRAATHAMTATGTLLIAACQILAGGGSPSAIYAMLYIWVALHCSMFFSWATVAAHLALATAAHATALVWLGETAAIAPQLTVTLGTQVAATLVVGSLATRQRHLADTDPLTGLRNRRAAGRALDGALEHSRRGASPTCVAMLDLDGFKRVNDAWGHAVGDRLLAEAAAVWRSLIRRSDTLARTGGDEFVVVLADCDLEEAEQTVRRLIVHAPGRVSASAGLARWDGRETAAQLLERADEALYRAKVDGPLSVSRVASLTGDGRDGAVGDEARDG